MKEVSNTKSTAVGDRIVDLNPLNWNVINPLVVNCPFTCMVCEDIEIQEPLKLATCEHNMEFGTIKYDGIDS